MNWIDVVILVVWGLSSGWGYGAGLIQMVIPLTAVFVGLAVSSRIADSVGNILSPFTDNEDYQTIAGFILIFMGLFILASIAGFMMRTILRFVPFGGMANKLAGMAAGLALGILLVSGVLTAIQRFPVNDGLVEDIDGSALGAFLADKFDVVIRGVGLIPGDWDNELENIVE